MSRQHTNTALLPSRRLSKQYSAANPAIWQGIGAGNTDTGTNAMGNVNPNSLASTAVSTKPLGRQIAMGVTGANGVVSFWHNGASQVISLYFWSERAFLISGGANGWLEGAEGSAGYTKTVDGYALCTFTAPEKVPYFLTCTGEDVTEVMVSGDSDGANPNTNPA